MMMDPFNISNEIVFRAKPDAVPFNYRISYKITQLCLIIEICCRGGCSITKLHMIATGLSTNQEFQKLINFTYGKQHGYIVVRFDPAVNRAIKFALAEGLLKQQKNGLFRLTNIGKAYVKKVIHDVELMKNEKRSLFSLGVNLTEDTIEALKSFWRYTNVKN